MESQSPFDLYGRFPPEICNMIWEEFYSSPRLFRAVHTVEGDLEAPTETAFYTWALTPCSVDIPEGWTARAYHLALDTSIDRMSSRVAQKLRKRCSFEMFQVNDLQIEPAPRPIEENQAAVVCPDVRVNWELDFIHIEDEDHYVMDPIILSEWTGNVRNLVIEPAQMTFHQQTSFLLREENLWLLSCCHLFPNLKTLRYWLPHTDEHFLSAMAYFQFRHVLRAAGDVTPDNWKNLQTMVVTGIDAHTPVHVDWHDFIQTCCELEETGVWRCADRPHISATDEVAGANEFYRNLFIPSFGKDDKESWAVFWRLYPRTSMD